MITNQTPSSLSSRRRPARRPIRATRGRRRGSTLLIVLTLMGLLALLGVLFYTFAAQERATAASFSKDARVLSAPSLEPESLMDYALEQLILGPDDSKVNSALAGGRHSLIPNMLGRDGVPFNGEGVNVRVDGAGNPIVDQNYDGTDDGSTSLLELNDSMAAHGSSALFGGTLTTTTLPAPDVEYTYPDINHAFLAYRGTLPGQSTPVIIPSFHRPAALPVGLRTSSGTRWHADSTVKSRVFRPHVNHNYATTSGATSTRRFVINGNGVDTTTTLGSLGLQDFFPAANDADGDGITGEQGLYESGSTSYEYDVDLDGDGIRESVLLDLDFTPQRRGDGKLVVPMFAFHITDAQGLIDLNSAGNIGVNPYPDATIHTPLQFGNNRDFSRSNSGVTASEINPLVALFADPGTASDALTVQDFEVHNKFLQLVTGTYPASQRPANNSELRNVEAFFLLMGKPTFGTGTPSANSIYDMTPGRYGEVTAFPSALQTLSISSGATWNFPAPGILQTDDNSNQGLTQFPSFGWPYDYRGWGNPHNLTSGSGRTLNFLTNTSAAIGPNRWPQFNSYHSNGDVLWGQGSFAGQLMTSPGNQLLDEPFESLTDVVDSNLLAFLNDPSRASTQPSLSLTADAAFGADETAFLQLSPSDGSRLANGSRLAKLASANFVDSARSWDIRRQFTASGGDRREAGRWKPNTTIATGAQNTRSWEAAIFAAYRAPVQWLFRESVNTSDPFGLHRWKLNLQAIVTDQNGDPFPAATPTSLQFRTLTNHPVTGLTATRVPTGYQSYQVNPPTSSTAYQEYWARVDRQAMARDIYTMLYLLGGEQNVNYSTADNSGSAIYSTAQLKEMAQFAINVVDSMDSDNVISRFEYDTNLADGWSLTDNDPYTNGMETDRAEVWGVERQQLVLNEALAIYAPPNDDDGMGNTVAPSDHPATDWDDTSANYFTYIELLNASPTDVRVDASNWQVMIWPRGSDPTVSNDRQAARQLIFRDSVAVTVAGGQRYTIGTDAKEDLDMSSMPKPSIFKVDRDLDGFSSADNLVPFVGSLNLDLIKDRSSNKFYILDGDSPEFVTGATPTDYTSTAGSLLNSNNVDPAIATPTMSGTPTLPLVVSVRRRANLYRIAPTLPATVETEENDNPWIEVDRIEIGTGTAGFMAGMQKFELKQNSSTSSNPTLTALVNQLRSATSSGPFDDQAPAATSSQSDLSHTINQANRTASATDPAGTVTQFHFDRPFQSLAELLEIPLVGFSYSSSLPSGTNAHILRQAISLSKLSGEQQYAAATKVVSFGGKLSLSSSTTMSPPTNAVANRWYRILNFLELPGTTNVALSSYATSTFGTPTNLGWMAEAGRMNLNTLRNYTALAAILDEPTVYTMSPPQVGQTNYLVDNIDGTNRDWWQQFLQSRDTFSGTPDAVTGLLLPGLGNSRPFRGLDFVARPTNTGITPTQFSRDDTVLRRLPLDASLPDSRMLFELGPQTEHASTAVASANDSYARYRLYQKVLNRTTTRSNTFLVYVGVQFHEAVEVDVSGTKVVRIGGRLEDTPIHRGFFVVDRSGAIDQVKRLLAPSAAGGAGRTADHDASTGVLKQQTLTTPVDYYSYRALSAAGADDGIDWKSLIKFRQLLN